MSEQQKREFCALMLKDFGVQIDIKNELLPVYYVAYRTSVINEAFIKKSTDSFSDFLNDFNKSALEKLKGIETRQIRFQSPKEAFSFGLSAYCFSILGSVFLICVLFFSIHLINNNELEANAKTEAITSFFSKALIEKKMMDKSVSVFTVKLFPSKDLGVARAGRNYIYNKKCDCIEVPIYFKKENRK